MRLMRLPALAFVFLFLAAMGNRPSLPEKDLVRFSGLKETYGIDEKIVLNLESLSDQTLRYSCYVGFWDDEGKWHEITYVCEGPPLEKLRYHIYELKAFAKKQTFWNFDKGWAERAGGKPFRFRLDFYYGEFPINPYARVYSEKFQFKQE